ncbi:uncharacterized protein YBL113C-like isoform X2 [Silurus meridionalis]|uniref:uncharacterized protein YBL113C-like isoform X2 n=1 Tax=Silurus meridionalis TaxID=175797 RepID=UPI001EECE5DC|nr:uncharacterized protein YBL113C-like isoform X2 [Silurus meridionalis]
MAARTIFLIFCYFLFFKNDAASTQSTVIPITKDTEKAAASTLSTVIPITKDTGEKAAASTLSTVIPITKDTGEKAAASTQSTVIHTTNNTGATSRSTDHVNTTTDGVISLSTAATLISSTQNPSLSNDTQGNTNLNATSAPNYNTTVIEKTNLNATSAPNYNTTVIGNTNSNATSAPSHNKTVTENTKLNATSAPNGNKTGPENTGNKADSEQHERGTKDKEADHKWVWIVLGLSAVAIIVAGAYWKCYKAQNHPVETMDHGTENASFQRTESNKDGVMLLGVKTGGEENAAAK